MKISILSPNLSGCVSILDTGVTYLATYIIERTRHTATIWDFTFRSKEWKEYLKNKLETDKPDVIGITYTTLYKQYVVDSIAEIRKINKDIPIILGGYHPTLKPRDSLQLEGINGFSLNSMCYVARITILRIFTPKLFPPKFCCMYTAQS